MDWHSKTTKNLRSCTTNTKKMVSGCVPLLSVCVLMFPAKFFLHWFFFSHLRKISWALYGWTDWLVNIKRAYSKIAGGGYFRFRDFSISNKPIRWPRAWLKWTNQELCMHKIQSWIPNFLQGANHLTCSPLTNE